MTIFAFIKIIIKLLIKIKSMKFFPFHTFFIIQIILFPRKYNFAKIIISHKKNRRQVIFESSDKKIPKKFFVCNIIYVFLILYFI